MAEAKIAVSVDIMGLKPTQELHAAACNAVSLLNSCPEIGRLADVRRAHDTLRQALVDFADAFMDQPVTERERATVAAKHQRKPRKKARRRLND